MRYYVALILSSESKYKIKVFCSCRFHHVRRINVCKHLLINFTAYWTEKIGIGYFNIKSIFEMKTHKYKAYNLV